MTKLKFFTVYRRSDEGGVSGAGRILDGVVFHNGWVVVCWRTDIDAAKHGHSSLGLYPSWDAFHFVHIESHPENKSIVVFGTETDLDERLRQALQKPPD